MALPEKLYVLRKKSGLSQEQLAEALNVSRQAISKWEGGSATPESDKLLALSNYFGVSLDYLLKGGAPDAAPAEAQEEHRTMRLLSLILCFGGVAALIVYGVLRAITLCSLRKEEPWHYLKNSMHCAKRAAFRRNSSRRR